MYCNLFHEIVDFYWCITNKSISVFEFHIGLRPPNLQIDRTNKNMAGLANLSPYLCSFMAYAWSLILTTLGCDYSVLNLIHLGTAASVDSLMLVD
jgi:hypothetical protein